MIMIYWPKNPKVHEHSRICKQVHYRVAKANKPRRFLSIASRIQYTPRHCNWRRKRVKPLHFTKFSLLFSDMAFLATSIGIGDWCLVYTVSALIIMLLSKSESLLTLFDSFHKKELSWYEPTNKAISSASSLILIPRFCV